MANNINTPHDHFCKAALSDLRVAKSILLKHLPKKISSMVNFDTLQVVSSLYINEHLQKQESDILFKVDISGSDGYIYTLLEHQSTPDKLMPFRLFSYITEILNRHINNNAGNIKKQLPLPVVIPLVIYNGSRPYNCSKNLLSLFGEYGALMQEVFCNDFNLIDLSVIADKELRQDIWGGLTCFLMKHIHAQDMMSHLESMRSVFRLVEQQSGGKLITSMLTYVIDAGAISDGVRLDQFFITQSGSRNYDVCREITIERQS